MTNGFFVKRPTESEDQVRFYPANSSYSKKAQLGEALFNYLSGTSMEHQGIEISSGEGFARLSEKDVRKALKQYFKESG